MRHDRLVWWLVAGLLAACHIRPTESSIEEVPVLAARRLVPTGLVREPGGFAPAGDWHSPAADSTPDGPGFPTAEAAYASARAWLSGHFERDVPVGTINVQWVEYEQEQNMVSLQQIWLGLQTGIDGCIQFRGTTPVRISAEPYEFVAVPGSRNRVIAPTSALAAWRQAAINLGETLEQILAEAHCELLPTPRLAFVRSFEADERQIGGVQFDTTFHPAWLLDTRGMLGVDAHTGTPWHEHPDSTLVGTPIAGAEVLQGPLPTSGPPVPRLRLTRRKPIQNPEAFEEDGLGWKYSPRAAAADSPREQPYATDEEAVAAAIDWLTQHFGALPASTRLVATRIAHSASGGETASSEDDRGHTIVLRQDYLGTQIKIGSVIYIRGRTIESSPIKTVAIEPEPDSAQPLVTKEAAIKVVRQLMAAYGMDEEQLAQIGSDAHLTYVWSPSDNSGSDRPYEVYEPCWAMDEEASLLVDAHTGKVRRDG